jgi:hypothetical protein
MRARSCGLVGLLISVVLAVGLAACGEPSDEIASVASEVSKHDGTWTRLVTTGSALSERSTPAVAAIGRDVYVFGGARDDDITGDVAIYDDLHRFDTVHNRWAVLTPTGASPPPRVFAASVAHGRRMLVFGGAFFGPLFSDFSPYGDLWSYDVDDNRWTELRPVNPGPAPRSRPSAWIVGNKLYVFGGVNQFFQVQNDLWVYDLAHNAWTQLIAPGAAGSPPPRHEAAAWTRPHGGRLVMYGGESIDESFQFTVLGDTWEFDLASGAWTEVTPAPAHNVAPPRDYGTAVILGDQMYLYGGDMPGGGDCGGVVPQNPTDELWRFDLRRRVWEQLFPRGDARVPIKRTNSVRVGDAMYVFGGFDFRCVDAVTPAQLWNHDVFRFEP